MQHPAPGTLTPDNVAADLLAIADAADSDRFAYYGYSWLALSGLQLAIRTQRLWALVMGGFPPIDGPYEAMLAVTESAHQMAQATRDDTPSAAKTPVTPGDWDAAVIQTNESQTRQFVTLYRALQTFDDAGVQEMLTMSRMCFAGSEDQIVYGPKWGDVQVNIARPMAVHREVLEKSGWTVQLLPGLDHLSAMHGQTVLPLLSSWLRHVQPAQQ